MQISLSGDSIDQYFQILEHYVLPLMVVSTVVLFCGYLASRIYHRTVHRGRRQEEDELERAAPRAPSSEDGTAAFLRELRATPPIEDDEPQREPRVRPQHPFLRKRAANATSALRPRPAAAEAGPSLDSPAAAGEVPLAAGARLAARRSMEDGAGPEDANAAPAARRPETPREPPAEPPARAEWRLPPDRDTLPSSLGRDPFEAKQEPEFDAPRAGPPDAAVRGKADPPPVATSAAWWKDSDEAPPREEPSATVVQALKAGPPPAPADLEAARLRAGEIADSLDYAASVLQQAAALLAQRIQAKQGLELEDVRGIRINGFEQPQGVREDLRKLGGDLAEEVLAAYETVAKFDNVLRRLEQMAAEEPLDEGWNDLLRARISDTIYAVGQVRKSLGGYRQGAKRPANAGTDQTVPVGRRQL